MRRLVGWIWALAIVPCFGQATPAAVVGTWKIVRIFPTSNPGCWNEAQAKTVVGMRLKYAAHLISWNDANYPVTEALSRTLSRRKFQDEYKVDLPELGIRAESVTEIDLQHDDADITGATTEIPGDTIVMAGPGRIVVSACGVFYGAVKVSGGGR